VKGPARILRSRRLAVWLLVLVVAWSILGTIVPQAAEDPMSVARLAVSSPAVDAVFVFLGLYHAYSAWPFLLVLAFLTLSTVFCAWERTGKARRRWYEAGQVSRKDVDRVRERPHLEFAIGMEKDGEGALKRAASVLSDAGLKVRAGDTIVEGISGRWGLLGSPVFHWSLALLRIVVGAGGLTRSVGLMGIAVNGESLDVADSYGVLDEGPLFPGHPGFVIRVDEMDVEFMDGDVNRGAAPVVTLVDDGVVVASQRVHANNPLRHGWTTIHSSDYGYAPVISLESSGSVESTEVPMIVDFIEGDASRTTTAGIEFVSGSEEMQHIVFVAVLLDADEPKIEVELSTSGTSSAKGEHRIVVLGIGESAELESGVSVGFASLEYYSRLSVVHDWSVPWIYTLFGIGLVGVSVAVFDPYRRVLAVVVDGDDGATVHMLITRGQGALFEDKLSASWQKVTAE